MTLTRLIRDAPGQGPVTWFWERCRPSRIFILIVSLKITAYTRRPVDGSAGPPGLL